MQDEDQRRLRDEAELEVIRLLHQGEPAAATAIVVQHQINIPPEVLGSAQFQHEMKALGTALKNIGDVDAVTAAQVTLAYLKERTAAEQQSALFVALELVAALVARTSKRRSWRTAAQAHIEAGRRLRCNA